MNHLESENPDLTYEACGKLSVILPIIYFILSVTNNGWFFLCQSFTNFVVKNEIHSGRKLVHDLYTLIEGVFLLEENKIKLLIICDFLWQGEI